MPRITYGGFYCCHHPTVTRVYSPQFDGKDIKHNKIGFFCMHALSERDQTISTLGFPSAFSHFSVFRTSLDYTSSHVSHVQLSIHANCGFLVSISNSSVEQRQRHRRSRIDPRPITLPHLSYIASYTSYQGILGMTKLTWKPFSTQSDVSCHSFWLICLTQHSNIKANTLQVFFKL